MKFLFSLILSFLAFTTTYSQINKFKNVDQYNLWVMNYFHQPDAANVYSAFQYGATNRHLSGPEGKNILFGFFGSLFRTDSTFINEFYAKVKKNHQADIHNAFVGALWMANTKYSKMILKEYIESEHGRKFKSESIEFTIPFDIYNDPITELAHLDYIWADFFATGNPDDVLRIISVLRIDSVNSDIAKETLITHGIKYKEVYEIINYQSKEVLNKYIKTKLQKIVSVIDEELEE